MLAERDLNGEIYFLFLELRCKPKDKVGTNVVGTRVT
jgi:hypothetical protein